jgi:hypothetical protein
MLAGPARDEAAEQVSDARAFLNHGRPSPTMGVTPRPISCIDQQRNKVRTALTNH